MRLRVALTLCLSLSLAPLVARAHGVNLRLGDCSANNGVNSAPLACAATSQPVDLVASVELSNALPNFCGASALIDFQAASASLPNWWRFDGPGCRSGSCTAAWNASSGNACTALWGPPVQSGMQMLSIEEWQFSLGGANRIRYNGAAALAGFFDITQQDPRNGISEWGVVRLHITFDRTTGGMACSGCTTGMCVVFAQADLHYGDNGEKKASVTTPGTGGNAVMLNPAVAGQGCADGRAVRNTSWGSIKSLYR